MHESPVKLCGAAADALFVLMNGQEACEIQSKGTRALRSNQRFHRQLL